MTTPADSRITELLDAIATTPPGHTTTWTHNGIDVTVYGQRRYELHTPTPWAVITIAGRIRPIHTWQQLLDHVDALAASTEDGSRGPDVGQGSEGAGNPSSER